MITHCYQKLSLYPHIPPQNIISRKMHVRLHALKYEFLGLGLSLDVREDALKKKKNYTCINLSAKEALSYKRKNSDRNIREGNKIKVIKIRNKKKQHIPKFHLLFIVIKMDI